MTSRFFVSSFKNSYDKYEVRYNKSEIDIEEIMQNKLHNLDAHIMWIVKTSR